MNTDNIEITLLKKKPIPTHIAIIMDGNGRWAKKRTLPRINGHKKGVETVREIVKLATKIGIQHLTLYVFSSENWNRPKFEVIALANLLVNSLGKELEELHKNKIKITTIGNINLFSKETNKKLLIAKKKTENNTGMNLCLALSYGSKEEIIVAVKNIINDIEEKKINTNDLNPVLFEKYLYTNKMPNPELLIRTGGELRISNFLLWQVAYTELYFSNKLWPEFSEKDFINAIIDYQNRERRFGLTSEQITK